MRKIDIPRHEVGVTRVFSLSMAPDEARALREDVSRQKTLLGLDTLESGGVEVFPVSDLGEIGLAGYLRDGVDAREEDLNRDRAKLAALDGWVMLIHSSAFGGQAAVLTPAAPLTLIGSYTQTAPDSPSVELESEAAQPYSGTPPPAAPTRPARSRGGWFVTLILLLLAISLLWWALA